MILFRFPRYELSREEVWGYSLWTSMYELASLWTYRVWVD